MLRRSRSGYRLLAVFLHRTSSEPAWSMMWTALMRSWISFMRSCLSWLDLFCNTPFSNALGIRCHNTSLQNTPNIQISDIAEYIGITRSYLFHIFKQNLNIAPKEYLLQYRMDKAKEFLEETRDSIQDIASNVGYHDSLAFSKMFRHVVGESPSQYRKAFFNKTKSSPIE